MITTHKFKTPLASIICAALLLSISCVTAVPLAPDPSEKELTVGVAQKEIRAGMSAADVASALGSPNIVTRDGDGLETWIYDKISSEARNDSRAQYATIFLLGAGASSATATTSQRTLTVVIKFDPSGKVATFVYHASKF